MITVTCDKCADVQIASEKIEVKDKICKTHFSVGSGCSWGPEIEDSGFILDLCPACRKRIIEFAKEKDIKSATTTH